jgi:hypothetical protein
MDMGKVIVFHYTDRGKLPKLTENELNELMGKFYDELKNYPDVKLNGTFVDEEGRGMCDWEAPDADVVKEIVKNVLGEPPADGAISVKRVL